MRSSAYARHKLLSLKLSLTPFEFNPYLTYINCVKDWRLFRGIRSLKLTAESTNLAFNKPSIQSGTDSWNFPSYLGNDENRNGNLLSGGSCIQTASVNEPLWSVDLQANYSIGYVRFTNRYYDGKWFILTEISKRIWLTFLREIWQFPVTHPQQKAIAVIIFLDEKCYSSSFSKLFIFSISNQRGKDTWYNGLRAHIPCWGVRSPASRRSDLWNISGTCERWSSHNVPM